jgi:hypothetical protein
MFGQMNGDRRGRRTSRKLTDAEFKAYQREQIIGGLIFAFVGIPLIGLLLGWALPLIRGF